MGAGGTSLPMLPEGLALDSDKPFSDWLNRFGGHTKYLKHLAKLAQVNLRRMSKDECPPSGGMGRTPANFFRISSQRSLVSNALCHRDYTHILESLRNPLPPMKIPPITLPHSLKRDIAAIDFEEVMEPPAVGSFDDEVGVGLEVPAHTNFEPVLAAIVVAVPYKADTPLFAREAHAYHKSRDSQLVIEEWPADLPFGRLSPFQIGDA